MPSGGTTTNQIQNKDPWAPAQPYLQDIMGQASQLYNSGAGSQTYGGQLVAPTNLDTMRSIDMTRGLAGADTSQPFNYTNSVLANGGMVPGTSAGTNVLSGIASGANGITTGQQYGNAYNAATTQNAQPNSILGNYANATDPTAAAQYLQGMASGASSGQNPALQTMLQDNANRIGNRVASQMSGAGRLGSFGYGDALARSITAANAPIISDAYNNDQNRMLSASGLIDNSQRALDAQRIGAATTLGSSNRADLGLGLNALAGQTGVQGQNISNQANASNNLISALQGGQGQALQAAGMAPTLDALRYSGANQMAGIGQYQQDANQRIIDAQRQLFEQQQAMPWTNLNRYLGNVSGLGNIVGQAGTTTGNTQVTQQTPWTQYAGLGLTAAGMLL